jgi:hypothetical protein
LSITRRRLSWALKNPRSGACGGKDNIPMRETRLGLTQWYYTDSGFEFNTLFYTSYTVERNASVRRRECARVGGVGLSRRESPRAAGAGCGCAGTQKGRRRFRCAWVAWESSGVTTGGHPARGSRTAAPHRPEATRLNTTRGKRHAEPFGGRCAHLQGACRKTECSMWRRDIGKMQGWCASLPHTGVRARGVGVGGDPRAVPREPGV